MLITTEGGFASGSNNLVEGSSSAAMGRNNNTIGFNSFAAGQANDIQLNARESIALGDNNKLQEELELQLL